MKKMKNKFLKNFLFIFFFLFLFFIYNNYIIYKNNNIKILLSKPAIFLNSNNKKSFSYNKKYIDKFSKKELSEENSVGISTVSFELELDNLKSKDIYTISIDSDDKIEETNLSLVVRSNGNIYTYVTNNFTRIDNKYLLVINKKNVDKIHIKGLKENFKNSPTEDILINKINVNNQKDINLLKKEIFVKNILAIVFVVMFIILMFIAKKIKIYDRIPDENLPKIFLIVAIFLGSFFSFLFPLYQIPDESIHINMIYSEMNMNVKFNEEIKGYGDTIRIMHNYDEKIDKTKYFDLSKKYHIKEKYKLPSINLIRHLPQSLGLIIGDILSLPILITITLAEFFAVLFYSLICYKSLKLFPIKRELMMCIMLLPICIQQMGSFSYDVMLLSMCFLFIAYIFNYKYKKEYINSLDFLKLIVILIIIGLVKLPYIILGALIILIPLRKININFKKINIDYKYIIKHKKKFILILIILFILFSFLLLCILRKMYFGRLLLAAIRYPKKSIPLLIGTFWYDKFNYIRGISSEFGWLDTHSSIFFVLFVTISLFFFSFINYSAKGKKVIVQECQFKKWEIIYMYIIALFLTFIIILSMVDWTAGVMGYKNMQKYSIFQLSEVMNTLPFIGGLQGRYFIPVIPLLFIPIYSKNISNRISKYNLSMLVIIYYIVIFFYLFSLILFRYWI